MKTVKSFPLRRTGDAIELKKYFCVWRIQHNMTQREMANAMGLNDNHLSNIENGREKFSELYYNRFVNTFNPPKKDCKFLLGLVESRKQLPYRRPEIEKAYLKAIQYIQQLQVKLGVKPDNDQFLWEKFFDKSTSQKKCKKTSF